MKKILKQSKNEEQRIVRRLPISHDKIWNRPVIVIQTLLVVHIPIISTIIHLLEERCLLSPETLIAVDAPPFTTNARPFINPTPGETRATTTGTICPLLLKSPLPELCTLTFPNKSVIMSSHLECGLCPTLLLRGPHGRGAAAEDQPAADPGEP